MKIASLSPSERTRSAFHQHSSWKKSPSGPRDGSYFNPPRSARPQFLCSFLSSPPTGKPQTAVTAQFTERGRAVTKVVSPTVLARVRDHFGCPTLNGAELENDGGNGTALSHWEARIFQGEAMVRAPLIFQERCFFLVLVEALFDWDS